MIILKNHFYNVGTKKTFLLTIFLAIFMFFSLYTAPKAQAESAISIISDHIDIGLKVLERVPVIGKAVLALNVLSMGASWFKEVYLAPQYVDPWLKWGSEAGTAINNAWNALSETAKNALNLAGQAILSGAKSVPISDEAEQATRDVIEKRSGFSNGDLSFDVPNIFPDWSNGGSYGAVLADNYVASYQAFTIHTNLGTYALVMADRGSDGWGYTYRWASYVNSQWLTLSRLDIANSLSELYTNVIHTSSFNDINASSYKEVTEYRINFSSNGTYTFDLFAKWRGSDGPATGNFLEGGLGLFLYNLKIGLNSYGISYDLPFKQPWLPDLPILGGMPVVNGQKTLTVPAGIITQNDDGTFTMDGTKTSTKNPAMTLVEELVGDTVIVTPTPTVSPTPSPSPSPQDIKNIARVGILAVFIDLIRAIIEYLFRLSSFILTLWQIPEVHLTNPGFDLFTQMVFDRNSMWGQMFPFVVSINFSILSLAQKTMTFGLSFAVYRVIRRYLAMS